MFNFERFIVNKLKTTTDKSKDILIFLEIKTLDKYERHIETVKYDVEYIIDNANNTIDSIEKEKQKNKPKNRKKQKNKKK